MTTQKTEALSSVISVERDPALLRTATELIDSSLYDGRVPAQRKIDHLLTARYPVMQVLDHGQRRLLNAGRLMALVRADRMETAMQVADDMEESWPDPSDRDLPIQTMLAFDAALTEAYLAAGNSLRAMGWAVRLARHVEETSDPRWRYRVSGLLAASYAVNGQLDAAEAQVSYGKHLAAEEGWDVDRAEYMHAVAEIFLGVTALDIRRLQVLLSRVRKMLLTQPTAQSLGDIIEALILTLRGGSASGMDLAQRIQQGVTQPDGPRLIRYFAQIVQALQLLRDWDSLRAINVLRQEGVENHVACPNVFRGIARLQMGDYAGALAATSECVKMQDTHSLWIFPLITLTRAVAHTRLNNNGPALRNLATVHAHARGKHFAGALWLLPQDDLLELISVAQLEGVFTESELEPFRQSVMVFSRQNEAGPPIQDLSERERLIAHYLRGNLSLREIARTLYVSPGTVTAQASAIYRKLGVQRRREAVLCLERCGFYES